MAWRVAKSLETLRKQVNAMAPNRSKDSDGSIGDEKHASRSSDHNPWIKIGSMGVVTAVDITHDPGHGFDSWAFAEMLRLNKDKRIKYVISNGRIFSATTAPWQWRKYTGANKHDHHVHISVVSDQSGFDDASDWNLGNGAWNQNKSTPAPSIPQVNPTLKAGSKGDWVVKLQSLLKVEADGHFGPKTKAAVVSFQKSKGLVADGIVGHYTWVALGQ